MFRKILGAIFILPEDAESMNTGSLLLNMFFITNYYRDDNER